MEARGSLVPPNHSTPDLHQGVHPPIGRPNLRCFEQERGPPAALSYTARPREHVDRHRSKKGKPGTPHLKINAAFRLHLPYIIVE